MATSKAKAKIQSRGAGKLKGAFPCVSCVSDSSTMVLANGGKVNGLTFKFSFSVSVPWGHSSNCTGQEWQPVLSACWELTVGSIYEQCLQSFVSCAESLEIFIPGKDKSLQVILFHMITTCAGLMLADTHQSCSVTSFISWMGERE